MRVTISSIRQTEEKEKSVNFNRYIYLSFNSARLNGVKRKCEDSVTRRVVFHTERNYRRFWCQGQVFLMTRAMASLIVDLRRD